MTDEERLKELDMFSLEERWLMGDMRPVFQYEKGCYKEGVDQLLSTATEGPQSPRWHRTALWVGWIGNIVLVIAVIVLGIWVSHLLSEKGQTLAASKTADPSTAECSARLEHFRSQLTQKLCHPAQPSPAGGSGCKLCPTDWHLRGDKCYWVGRGSKTWSESYADCSARGSQLLVIRDRKELESLQDLTGGTSQFWVGLSLHSPEKAWTWLNSSRLDQTQFPVSGPAEGNSCGALAGKQLNSDTCSSAFQWICQRDAVPLQTGMEL
ncbi:killer cell lectin-like receptor subfamily B member 1B allele B [Gopherus flavomarginatus]|uniref:killer cell lectin-like receptor subfamily B member 1B allele B n=1 Tax=Gopherus flavomarginatus TaxID=286002 RepID=UPI0021CBE575|nr:killer cell lectin-like receptor subfamily B member 1B allele B [Gopherus flavomarginatus]